MSSKEENEAIEMFNPESGQASLSKPFTATVHVVDEDEEDPDIDMDLTMADIKRAFVSKRSQW